MEFVFLDETSRVTAPPVVRVQPQGGDENLLFETTYLSSSIVPISPDKEREKRLQEKKDKKAEETRRQSARYMEDMRVKCALSVTVVAENKINREILREEARSRIEPKKKRRRLSADERLIVVREVMGNGRSCAAVADTFGVCPKTIWNIAYGKTSPQKKKSGGRPRILTDAELSLAARFLCVHPEAHMADVQKFLSELLHKEIKCNTLSKLLTGKHGFKRSDFRYIPRRRNAVEVKEARKVYVQAIVPRLEELKTNAVFIDESGWTREVRPFKGWTFRGIRPALAWEGLHMRHITAIAAVSPKLGLVHAEYELKTVNAERFCDYMDNLLLKTTDRFEEEGTRGVPIFIFDNAPTHNALFTRDWFLRHREECEVMRLPPYSPFLNPIEEVFSVWKARYISQMWNPFPTLTTPLKLVQQCAAVVQPDLCMHCFNHTTKFFLPSLTLLDISTHEMFESSHEGDEHFTSFQDLQIPSEFQTSEELDRPADEIDDDDVPMDM